MNRHLILSIASAVAITVTGLAVSPLASVEAKPVFVGVEDGANIGLIDHRSGKIYDAVSYFQGDGVPKLGNAIYSATHDGIVYHFSSKSNAKKFKKDPLKFIPQYGGHCAWAMSRGSLAPGDPQLYKVVDGRLFLNFNENVQKTWLGDVSGFIGKSDAKWKEIPEDAKAFGQ